MKKKLSVLLLLCVLFSVTSNAQEKSSSSGSSFGVKAGINIANLKESGGGISVSYSSLIGLTGGFYLKENISKSFAIQPELLYSTLGAKFQGDKLVFGYLEVPVLAKYTFTGTGFAIHAGPQIGFKLNAKDKYQGASNSISDQLKSTDFAGVLGADYTLPMGLGLCARYQFGLTNIAKDNGSAGVGSSSTVPTTLKNNAFTITLSYRLSK